MKIKKSEKKLKSLEKDLLQNVNPVKKGKVKKKKKKSVKNVREREVLEVNVDLVEEVTVPKKKPDKVAKIRKGATSENVEENFMIVPWSSSEEWAEVCRLFHEGDFTQVAKTISIWQKRVPTLPVGVEASLFLVEALIYDDKFQSKVDMEGYSEDQVRSLYSLAIIRYLNHVSQLATQSLGGSSKLLTRELASIVDTPEWLVALRNDVSHGATAPSIEVLRMGGDFVLEWLKEKYWKLPDHQPADPSIPDAFTVTSSNEATVYNEISELISAYLATRIYKARKLQTIDDPNILLHIPDAVSPVKTKAAMMHLKNYLRPLMTSHPSLFSTIISQELIPTLEFYADFKSILNLTSEEEAFEKLFICWMPIIKLLESKGKLISVLENLSELITSEEYQQTWPITGKWIDKLLEICEMSGKKHSKHLVAVLAKTVKHPNPSTSIFLERLFRVAEPAVGRSAIDKLSLLTSIWMDSGAESKKKRKTTENKLFSMDDITPQNKTGSAPLESGVEDFQEETCKQPTKLPAWTVDTRGAGFWRNIPIGGRL